MSLKFLTILVVSNITLSLIFYISAKDVEDKIPFVNSIFALID